MSRYGFLTTLLCCMLFLTACETLFPPEDQAKSKDSAKLESPIPKAEPGREADLKGYGPLLVSYYRQLADEEFKELDWTDAYRFNRKADEAERGEAVLPDDPATRSRPVSNNITIRQAYVTLMGHLQSGRWRNAPEEAARAEAAYDCWIEQSEESYQEMTSGKCREQFYEAVKKLEDAVIEDAMSLIEAPQAKPQQAAESQKPQKKKALRPWGRP